MNFGDEIAYQLRLARKKKWNQIEDKRIKEEIELQSYLHQLILKDREERIQKARLMVSTDHHSDNTNGDEDDVGSSTSCLNRISSESNVDSDESDVQLIANQCDNYRAQLDSLFSQNDMRRKVCIEIIISQISCHMMHPFLSSEITEERCTRLFVWEDQF